MSVTRRKSLMGGAVLALGVLSAAMAPAHAQTAPVQAAPLPDLVYGKADAAVVIEEYASLSCPACGSFYTNVLPHLQKTYIDTGKVKFVYRDYPLNDLAVGAAMLARCVNDKRGDMISVLYKTQKTWMGPDANPLEELLKIGRQFGMKQDDMEKCLSNDALMKGIIADAEKFDKDVKIDGTPTFVINGKKFTGEATPAGFDVALKALVK